MNEEGAHEEADADEEVEGVDEGSAPLWAKGKNKEHAVSREEDSITSKLKNVKNGRKEWIGRCGTSMQERTQKGHLVT